MEILTGAILVFSGAIAGCISSALCNRASRRSRSEPAPQEFGASAAPQPLDGHLSAFSWSSALPRALQLPHSNNGDDKRRLLILGNPFRPHEPERLQERVDVLGDMVVTLVREVEALRHAQLIEASARGVAAKDTAYGAAYRQVAERIHDSGGVSCGIEKILALWSGVQMHPGEQLPELGMLRRLGLTDEEIQRHRERVRWLSSLT